MAADYDQMARNLEDFYQFKDKVVVFVGAGTKQLLDVGRIPKRTIAIDQSAEAVQQLRQQVEARHLESVVEIIQADFFDVISRGDVVYFEFCLHEMTNPHKALAHAKSLAPDIVVYDHAPGSEWAYMAAEEDKVARSTQAMERFGIRSRQLFRTDQHFKDYAELLAKVSPQGPLAVERAARYANVTGIAIPMEYGLTLL
ncbi:MAG TPA: class I SAM-dependent methyltransferase [Terracidiphilus sp.]|nr:class I SAM-dependent methyltransferase [Terracidiphilus sp.]